MAFDALLGSDDGVIQTLERNTVFCWRHENSLEHRQHAGGNTMGRYVRVELEEPGSKLVAEHRVELKEPGNNLVAGHRVELEEPGYNLVAERCSICES